MHSVYVLEASDRVERQCKSDAGCDGDIVVMVASNGRSNCWMCRAKDEA